MDILKKHNVNVIGSGSQAIMFAHGYGCDQNMWRFVAPAFLETHRVILFDYIGSGKSDSKAYSPLRYNRLDGYAEDVAAIANALNLNDAIFVGHSVSAMIGALTSIRDHSLFSRLVMVGPSPRYINDGDYVGGFNQEDIEDLLESLESNYLGWSTTMAPVIMGNSDRPELGQELTNSFCQMDPQIAKIFARTTFLSDSRDELPKIPSKSLILQCSSDVIAPLEVGHYVHKHIPDSKLVIMKATGHCPNLSAPEETVSAIREFLNS